MFPDLLRYRPGGLSGTIYRNREGEGRATARQREGLDLLPAKIRSVFPVLVVDATARTTALPGLHRSLFDGGVPFHVRRPGLPVGRLQDLAPELF